MVKKAREGVMEFLLINHPLDCPICDQGGECDLQDEAMGYGRDDSRYRENKRAVEEKFMGPLIKTVMTRCIQCTRCVRFATEIAGVSDLGLIGRGEDAEITTYLEKAIASELSGNLADICPVGALTHKPWAFNYRSWELRKTQGVDVMDAVGSAIRIDARGPEVMRILPRVNEAVNEEWIADKSRYAVDGLVRQRLDRPFVRVGGKLREASWGQALAAVAAKIKGVRPDRIGVIAGDLSAAEEMKAALDLFGALGVTSLDCRQDGSAAHPKWGRESYLFNTTIQGIEDADAILLIGCNPRTEAPIINARIRKRWVRGEVEIGMIGEPVDLTYPYEHVGTDPSTLRKADSAFAKAYKAAARPLLILGSGAIARPDGAAVMKLAAKAARKGDGWNGFNVLHAAASRVAGLDLGFVPGEGGKTALELVARGGAEVLVLLGADEIDLSQTDAFVVYIGSHGDAGAHRADVILPGAAYTEKPGLYVNTEGRVQMAERAVFPPGEAREDWAILRALSDCLGARLPYDSVDQLRSRLVAEHPTFGQVDYAPGPSTTAAFDLAAVGETGEITAGAFTLPVEDFYMTNPIARASPTMAACSALHAASRMAAE
jgi:NADH-quinone oxidoreductase subunit G